MTPIMEGGTTICAVPNGLEPSPGTLPNRPPSRARLPSLYARLEGRASVRLRQLGGVGRVHCPGVLPGAPWQGSTELLGVPVRAWFLLFLQSGQSLDNGTVEVLKPFGGSGHTILHAEPNPDWLSLRPGKENGAR